MALSDLARVGVFRYVAGLLSRDRSDDYILDKLTEKYGGSQTANTIKAVLERGRQAFAAARKLFTGIGGPLRLGDIPKQDVGQNPIEYSAVVGYRTSGQAGIQYRQIGYVGGSVFTSMAQLEQHITEAFYQHITARGNRTRYPGKSRITIVSIEPFSIQR